MPAKFSVEYEGRTVEVIPDALWERDRVRLVVDGETVAERKANGKRTVLEGDGFEVRAVMPFWGGSVSRASLVPEGSEDEYELDPEPGTRAARQADWGRRHPGLYASRYVLTGVAQVAAAIIGITFALRLLPSIDLPSIPLPSIDLPDLPLPSFQIDLELPGWVQAVLDSKPYWVPIVVGLVLASRELQRRKKVKRPH
ncbi:hypothetical protein OJ997_24500 [Solirubrobacter phytolaccae]|uniref:Uncharacterized protein n=1 Tax=Solirubrobacter phytolaccae TaxID=1404360 RepID=A0A9X3NL59_9ACTN|nr:hypothetical protein [Solirubrobacter phytolaccae]MDA0183492.1 hypothetical protein [Solirubrobacter phytolaccae]